MAVQPQKLGILGGGQLGLMSAASARDQGVLPVVFDPDPSCPAAALAHTLITAAYDDSKAIETFAEMVDWITFEFENIPSQTLERLERLKPVCPSSRVLKTCRNRIEEKMFLKNMGAKTVAFEVVRSKADLTRAAKKLGYPCVLKTAELGYDGKGQYKLLEESDVEKAWAILKGVPCVLEAWCTFEKEISVICARNSKGEMRTFPTTENRHAKHILDVSMIPAGITDAQNQAAQRWVQTVAEKLELVGVLCAEMFVVGEEIWINELAPRPHNSGHHTLNSCSLSQFDAHVRAVCGLDLGDVVQTKSAAVMVNILGEDWMDGGPSLSQLKDEQFFLKSYGKAQARQGRKMGHFTVWGENRSEVLARALNHQHILKKTKNF